jgi:hypothetical protein
VTVTFSPPHPEHDRPVALIEEARLHRRKRQIVVGGCAALVVVAGVLVGLIGGGGPGVVPVTPGASFVPTVIKATELAGTAEMTVTGTSSSPGCPLSQTTWNGSIDFAHSAIALRAVEAKSRYNLCTQPTGVQLRQFGSVQYQTFPPPGCAPAPCHVVSSGPSLTTTKRPWFRSSSSSSGANAVDALQTPFALAVLDAMPATAQKGRTSFVLGQPARQYSAVITLADLESAMERTSGVSDHALGITSPVGAIPPSTAIPISISVWLDTSNRAVRISMTQPFYMVNFVSGASAGDTQFPPGFDAPHDVPSDYPYKRGYEGETVTFQNFGSAEHPVRPPGREVSVQG